MQVSLWEEVKGAQILNEKLAFSPVTVVCEK